MVWHTQGSGKSLTMAFYAGRIMRDLAMENPTVVVLTDRNDLDEQLFTTFSRCADLLGLPPVQAESRADLRAKLAVESGGVVFTTIQKFFPDAPAPGEREGATPRGKQEEREGANPRRKQPGDRHPLLSSRRNVVVIADEAHRSQYDFIDGYARHMRDALPNASFIGFTGTPIELADASTRSVFGDHISVYDIQRAVEDGATVPIYYESRLAKLALDESERPTIDAGFEEVTEGEEVDRREKLKTKWAQLEAIVGAEKRVALVARDIVEHFERRREALDGKAMVVCMSRRICIDLYRELVRLRPEWRDDDDRRGALKKEQAVRAMLEKYEVCCGLFHGFDRSAWANGSPAERLQLLPAAMEHVLAQEDGKARCLQAVRELSQAFALAVPHPETVRIRDDVSLFQHVRAALSKRVRPDAKSDEELDHAVRQIVSRAVAPDGVVDIFAAAGLKKPDVSILSEEFLREVRGMGRRNLAVELLERLLKGELTTRRRKNVVQARSFAEMLEQTIRRYQNRAVEAAQVIEELIGLAREMREANARGERLGLSDDELAFYDALGVNDSAVKVLGDETLRDIARELVETVRGNVTIDWTLRENVRANLRRLVKRVLRKHGYPPDKQESATRTVLEQAEVISAGWAA